MDYTFRINAFYQPTSLRLIDGELEIMDANKTVIRRVGLGQVRKIEQFAGVFATSDPKTGSFDTQFCVLRISGAKPVVFRNGYFLGPDGRSPMSESATNQTVEYGHFLKELKTALHRIDPNIRVVYGKIFAALAWSFNLLLGLGLIAIGVAMFFTDKLSVALTIGLIFLGFGGFLSWTSFIICRGYWPQSIDLAQDLAGGTV